MTTADWATAVEKVSSADISRLVQRLLKSKPTLVAAGDLSVLPHLDSLRI